MYAIVSSGGKQLKVAAGDVVAVEKIDAAVGETVKFDVLLLASEGEITVGDALASATVTGEIVEQFKGDKALIFKFKKRKGYKRTKGHRQELTRVRITEVSGEGAPKKKTATRKKSEAAAEVAEPAVETAVAVESE